jgi:hypothetical protein
MYTKSGASILASNIRLGLKYVTMINGPTFSPKSVNFTKNIYDIWQLWIMFKNCFSGEGKKGPFPAQKIVWTELVELQLGRTHIIMYLGGDLAPSSHCSILKFHQEHL